MLQPTISNEDTAQLPALVFRGRIVVIDKAEDVDAACDDLERNKIIGFDTETRPSFKAGVSYKVSLLQLSTPDTCYLFRINKVPFKGRLRDLLESRDRLILGADVAGDIRSLNALEPMTGGSFVDLQSIVWEWGVEEKSLRKMSAIILGHRISKAQRLSNWEAVALTPQQQQYAATDAWGCIELYKRLQEIPKLSPQEIAEILKRRKEAAEEAAARKAAKKAAKEAEWREIKKSRPRRNRQKPRESATKKREQNTTK